MFRIFKRKYSVTLRGENFNFLSESGVNNLGFFTTRVVSAESPEEAEKKAVELIKSDDSLINMLSDQEQVVTPKIFVEGIHLCPWWKKKGGGYSFFDMEKLNE